MKTKLKLGFILFFSVLGLLALAKVAFQANTEGSEQAGEYSVHNSQGIQLRKLNQPFSWHDDDDDDPDGNIDDEHHKTDQKGSHNDQQIGETENPNDSDENQSEKKIITCRNSVQGKVLIADDRGYVCARRDILSSTGCCNPKGASSHRYACNECNSLSGCCKLYEHCISCCMDPKKKPYLMSVLNDANTSKNILLLSVNDHFELCLAKCRTSSHSVQHENVYINPGLKHCFKKGPYQHLENESSSSTTTTSTSTQSSKVISSSAKPDKSPFKANVILDDNVDNDDNTNLVSSNENLKKNMVEPDIVSNHIDTEDEQDNSNIIDETAKEIVDLS